MFPFNLLDKDSPLGQVVGKVLDFIPDPKAKAEALAKAQEAMLEHQDKIMAAISEQNKSQSDINIEEAKSTNMFIAGGRPYIMWVCGAAFSWVYVIEPILVFGFNAAGHPLTNLPVIDFSVMSPIMTGMLGLAGMRTYEKYTNSESNR